MRRAYLVCYDIRDDKRLRRVAKAMRGFGERVQYSVFRCILGERERVLLQQKMETLIALSEDHILIVDLGLQDGRGSKALTTIGKPLPDVEELAYIF